MKKILATAYAINAYKGSEDGMGWNFVLQIARFNKVLAITRQNNRSKIEKFIEENPNDLYQNIEFLYFDLPYWMRFWKKGERGAMLYYLMWQYGIIGFIKKQKLEFDLVHNLNFHNDWTPSFLWKLKKPFVWGPIGHHPLIPNEYLKYYSKRQKIKNRATWIIKQYFWNFSISLNKSKTKAKHILCMNSSVSEVLHLKSNYSIMPSVATQDFGWNNLKQSNEKFTVISAGRFVSLKGFDLTIKAFAGFLETLDSKHQSNCELLIIGNGPEKDNLKKMASQLKIQNHIKFISWIERDSLLELFKTSSIFLFPSHEGAGMVVAEALSFGLPVVCLNNIGPGEFINNDCGFKIEMQEYENTFKALSNSILELYQYPEKRKQMSLAARNKFETDFHWDRRGEQLNNIYSQL